MELVTLPPEIQAVWRAGYDAGMDSVGLIDGNVIYSPMTCPYTDGDRQAVWTDGYQKGVEIAEEEI